MNQTNVLIIATERSWRGGENQIRLLIEGVAKESSAPQSQVVFHIAAPIDSKLRTYFGQSALNQSVHFTTIPTGFKLKTSAFLALAKYCAEQHIDLIDSHTGHGHTLGLLTKWWLKKYYQRNIKLIIHRHVDNVPKQTWLNKKKYQSPLIDQYIAISRAVAQVLHQTGVNPQNVTVVHSVVDPHDFPRLSKLDEKHKMAQAFGLDDRVCFLGNASALSYQKGYEVLLQALRLVKNENMSFHCFIAGEGELQKKLEDLREQLGLEYHVTFLGFVKDIHQFLSALDILCVPSRNEGLGTVLMEGALSGCALIGTNTGGIPEIIEHQLTGMLVEKNNPRQLADAIIKLIQDPVLLHSMAKASKAYISQTFSPKVMVEQNLQVYHRVLKT